MSCLFYALQAAHLKTNMKTLSALFLLFSFSVASQKQLFILNDATNEAVFNARITLESDSVLINRYSDFEGKIELPNAILKGNFVLKVTHPVFDSLTLTLLPRKNEIRLKKDFQSFDNIVVTAQITEQKAENAVHQITIIDREKIDKMGAVNLRDVLTNQAGVQLSQDNVLGSGMSLQGISGENVKIMIDGVPVVGRLNGNIDLSQINLQNIAHIEIIEGPLSVNYGTNALAGVINLITKKNRQKSITANIQSYYESIGHYNVSTNLSYGKKKSTFGIHFGRNFFDGWSESHDIFKNPTPIADSNRVMTWNSKEQYFAGLNYGYQGKKLSLNYKLDGFSELVLNRGYPRAPYQITAFDDYYYTQRLDNSIQLKYRVKDFGRIQFLASHNVFQRKKNTFIKDLTSLEENLSLNSADQDTSVFHQYISRMSYVRSKKDVQLNYEIGYDFLWETAQGKRIESEVQQQGDFAGFAILEYTPWQILTIRPALRYSYNTAYSTPLLPSLNIKLEPLKRLQLRASYARGFRAPTIKELYFEFVDINHNIVGNENLTAENSNNILASLSYTITKKKLSLKPAVHLFYNSIRNQIGLANTGDLQFSYVNIGELTAQGARFGLDFSVLNLSGQMNYNYLGRASSFSVDPDRMLYYSELQGSLNYAIPTWKMNISIFSKYQGRVPNLFLNENDEITEGNIADFWLTDLTISKKFFRQSLNIVAGSKNIFNITRVGITGISNGGGAHSAGASSFNVGTGRTYFISAQYNFIKNLKTN